MGDKLQIALIRDGNMIQAMDFEVFAKMLLPYLENIKEKSEPGKV